VSKSIVGEKLKQWFEETYRRAPRRIVAQGGGGASEDADAREAARKARELTSQERATESTSCGKMADDRSATPPL